MENPSTSLSPALPSPSTKARRRAITSCDTCRSRKVKCDRQHPVCSACRTAGRSCLYNESSTRQLGIVAQGAAGSVRDSPRGIRRRPRDSPRLDTIDARLERLEGLLEQIVKSNAAPGPRSGTPQASVGKPVSPNRSRRSTSASQSGHRIRAEDSGDGTLLVSPDGGSQFVSSHHWSLLATELQDIREILATEKVSIPADLPNDIYDIANCLPLDAEVCYELLRIFETNVDPVVRLVHKPSLRRQFALFVEEYINALSSSPHTTTESIEENLENNGLLNFRPLVFAILYSAINSLPESTVAPRFGSDKARLLATYHRGLQLSLQAADYCNTSSIEVVQAYVLFLSSQIRDDNIGRTFALLAAAVRIALSQGLHREPTIFRPIPDEVNVEVRRRVWSQLRYLEWRSAELKGVIIPSCDEDALTTRLPSNVNDSDLIVGRPPGLLDLSAVSERGKFTEMTFQICLFRMVQCAQQIGQNMHRRFGHASKARSPAVESFFDFEPLINETKRLLQTTREKNLRDCQFDGVSATPIQKLAINYTKGLEWKCWLIFWCGVPRDLRRTMMSKYSHRKVLRESLILLEMINEATVDESMEGFLWFLQAHSGLQTIMVLISELRDMTVTAEDVSLSHRAIEALKSWLSIHERSDARAWAVIRKYVDQLESDHNGGCTQQPQQQLDQLSNGLSKVPLEGLPSQNDILEMMNPADFSWPGTLQDFESWANGSHLVYE